MARITIARRFAPIYSYSSALLPTAQKTLGEKAQPELQLSQVEAATPVCRSLQEVRAELMRMRREMIAAAERQGRYLLIDVVDQRELSATALIEKMLDTLRPALEAEGNWEEIATLVRETLQQGNRAIRQRAAYQRNGRMEDVVAFMVAETRRGIGKGT